jgi:hypothetical protein
MSVKKSVSILFKLSVSFLLMTSLVSCAANVFSSKGSWVAKDDRVFIQDAEPLKGTWQTRDVTVEYACQQETQNLHISGVVRLGDYLTTRFNDLDWFTLNIYALDAEGVVLDSKLILFFGSRRSIDTHENMTFDKRLVLPADTAAIAFGYSGRVIEEGNGSRDQIDYWDFWKIPGHKP